MALKSEGLSVFLIELDQAIGHGMQIKPIANMVGHKTNKLFFDDLEIPADALIGKEGRGLAADASWEAANVAMQTFGGLGFAREYDIERKFRETRLYQVAPISTNLILSYLAVQRASLRIWWQTYELV